MFLHYADIVIFVLGYFILAHSVGNVLQRSHAIIVIRNMIVNGYWGDKCSRCQRHRCKSLDLCWREATFDTRRKQSLDVDGCDVVGCSCTGVSKSVDD